MKRWSLLCALLMVGSVGCQAQEASDSSDAGLGADVAADATDDAYADTAGWNPDAYPDDCATGLTPSQMVDCGEAHFWTSFQVEFDQRVPTYHLLSDIIDEIEAADAGIDERLATLYFRRSQLALALLIEQQETGVLANITTDIDRAMELNPSYDIVPPWKDAMEVATASLQNDWASIEGMSERIWQNVERAPVENTLSISGTTIGVPLSTGLPQETIEHLDQWECNGEPWCTENTVEAPFARPGLNFHFAESYARMGQRDKALEYYQKALDAPGAEQWPFRPLAQEAVDDIDAELARFEALGQDESAFSMVYANQKYGCIFCHSPADAVPADILER